MSLAMLFFAPLGKSLMSRGGATDLVSLIFLAYDGEVIEYFERFFFT